MNRCLMLHAALTLTAVAFAALPALASAGEFTADCENGAATCTANIVGTGVAEFANTSGERITCSATSGAATVQSGKTSGSVELNFTGCREHATFFTFQCNSVGKPAGQIATGAIPWFWIRILVPALFGMLFVNTNMTITCAGFSDKRFTGNIIGALENPNCGTFQANHTVVFEKSSDGHQKYKQVTGSGSIHDLSSNNDTASGAYATSSRTGTLHLNYTGTKVKLTC